MVFPGDAAEALAFLHHVDEAVAHRLDLLLDDLLDLLAVVRVGVDAVLELGETQGVLGGHAQRVGILLRAGDDAFGVLWVEEDQVGHRNANDFVDLVEAHAVAHHDGVGAMEQQAGVHGIEVMLGGVVHDIDHRDESRHVATGLGGQVRPDGPIVFHASADDGLVDGARARVVGGQHEEPVLIAGVEALEVLAGGFGLLLGVEAVVDERAHPQSVFGTRAAHELPQALGTCRRACRGVEGRLHHGQVFELQGEVVAREVFLKHGEIDVGKAQHAARLLTAAVGVKVDERLDVGVVRQRDRGLVGQGLDAFHVDAVVVDRHLTFLETVFVPHVLVDFQVDVLGGRERAHQIEHLHHRRLLHHGFARVEVVDALVARFKRVGVGRRRLNLRKHLDEGE